MNPSSSPAPFVACFVLAVALSLYGIVHTPWFRGFFRGRFRGGRIIRPGDRSRNLGPRRRVYFEPSGDLLGFLCHGYGEESGVITSGPVQLVRKRGAWMTHSTAEEVRAAFPHFRAVVLTLLALLLPLAAKAADHPAADLSQFRHPAVRWGAPVCAVGFVESVRTERDGDIHVWLCPSSTERRMPERRRACVLGEIVPSGPLSRPVRGAHVRMCGRWVESDIPHGWTELHPVERIEVLP